ncbi:hypothetical protein CBF34_04490 [Vagococcus penaei]|uniref:Uncharacterized protein n=1 Tax=Vagococcus penaei TaxID=633807 RepID=A0A1Q2D4H7_9ENTE|nr:peptidoglycan DD-metalloendopeptidase family protein [Vagococcus penaei]AQP53288.1 hypothetical protein BW732_02915 [Vagococcus penaei]RSU04058.1 hypothetical protein CBF34_04490 [Vagococcus penaei]
MKAKKSLIFTFAATCLVAMTHAGTVEAESIDKKIDNENKVINKLAADKNSADRKLSDIDANISALTQESDQLLSEKVTLEKEANQLTIDIANLEKAIEKRTEKIEEQARSTQVNQNDQDLVNVILDSSSVSDAISRTVAYTKLMTANNDIVQEQKKDQEELAAKQEQLQIKVEEITQKANDLKSKQTELESEKDAQLKLAQDILKSLDSAKGKKSELVAQKAQAEKIAAENARLQKEQAAREKEAKAVQAKALAKQQAAQKTVQQTAKSVESSETVSLSKPSSNPGTSNNTNTSSDASTSTESRPLPSSSSGFQRPIPNITITSGFGGRPDPNGFAGTWHDGIDMAGSSGQPIMASRAGTVVESSFHPSAGNHVIIQHDNGYFTYYMHLNAPGIASGSQVQAGDVIGGMGTTGNSTGVHLHFGISTGLWSGFMDPSSFIGL